VLTELERVLEGDPSDKDADLLRFLRARDFDVAQANAMLDEACKWRAAVKPAEIAPSMIARALQPSAWQIIGHARCGTPVLMSNAGVWRPSILENIDEYTRFVAYFCAIIEKLQGLGAEQMIVIFDQRAFTSEMTRPFAMRCIAKLVSVVQDFYPERLKRAFIVNSPMVFLAAWKIIRPWLDAKTASKVRFPSGGCPGEGTKELEALIDSSVLPQWLGGGAETPEVPPEGFAWASPAEMALRLRRARAGAGADADPEGLPPLPAYRAGPGALDDARLEAQLLAGCAGLDRASVEASTGGGTRTASVRRALARAGADKACFYAVGRGARVEVQLRVDPGQAAAWWIDVESHDIEFAVHYRSGAPVDAKAAGEAGELPDAPGGGADGQAVVAAARVRSHAGAFACADDAGGTLILRLCNRAAYIRGKRVRLGVVVGASDAVDASDVHVSVGG
jgi:hypothetical protein